MILIQLYGGPSDGAVIERSATTPLSKFIDVPGFPVSEGPEALSNGYCRHVYEQETIVGVPVVSTKDGRKYYRYRFVRTDH